MTDELYQLIDATEMKHQLITEFNDAIIKISLFPTVTCMLLDSYVNALEKDKELWRKIEQLDEFKSVYNGDRVSLIRAYDRQKQIKAD